MKNRALLKISRRISTLFVSAFIFSILSAGFLNAQNTPPLSLNTNEKKEEKNLLLAASEVFAANIFVWSYHEFLTKEGWADINWTTMKNNLKLGFTWDYDDFTTNQFLHPYHGSAYFNAARSNGYTFWESVPFVFGGSMMWEYFMENERPSYNDLVNTTVSGIIFGEITYRVSDLIINESTSGFERFFRETALFAINPMRGFNRLIKGKSWRKNGSGKSGFNRVNIRLSSGMNSLFFNRNIDHSTYYALFRFNMNYGSKQSVSGHKNTFDYFRVHSEISFAESDNVIAISASGVLWDKRFSGFGSKNNVAGIYKEFDLLANAVYKFSATSVAGEVTNITKFSGASSLNTSFGISALLMGASHSEYARLIGKDYNLGPGFGARIFVQYKLNERWNIYTRYKQYWIYITNGIKGNEFIGLFNFGVNYKLNDNYGIGADFILYDKFGNYDTLKDLHYSNASSRVYVILYL